MRNVKIKNTKILVKMKFDFFDCTKEKFEMKILNKNYFRGFNGVIYVYNQDNF